MARITIIHKCKPVNAKFSMKDNGAIIIEDVECLYTDNTLIGEYNHQKRIDLALEIVKALKC